MINFIISLLVSSAAFYVGARLLAGVHIKNYTSALIMALVVGLLNATIGAVMDWFTLGIITIIITTVVIKLADYLIDSVKIDGWLWAFILAIVVTVFNWLSFKLVGVTGWGI